MTIRDIDINASDFEAGTQYRTKDGKLVTLKHVCVEEGPRPRVDITDAAKGDILVLRNGQRYTCASELGGEKKGDFVWRAEGNGKQHWFWLDGTCKPLGPDMDVVELIKAPKPSVNIGSAVVGDKIRLQNGEIGEVVLVTTHGGANIQVRLPRSSVLNGGALRWYYPDGRRMIDGEQWHAVELVKRSAPRVSLAGLRVGDRFRVRSGEVFTCQEVDGCGDPIYAKGETHGGLYFLYDGRCNLTNYSDLEAVELIKPSVLEQIHQAIKGVDRESIDKVVVSEKLWHRAQEEAGVTGKAGPENRVYVDGIRVWYDPIKYSGRECHVVLKLR